MRSLAVLSPIEYLFILVTTLCRKFWMLFANLFVAFLPGSFMDLIDGRLCNWVAKIID